MEILVIIVMGFVYFLPSIIAGSREHNNAGPLFIINLAFGWSVIGWVGCFAWAFSSNK